MAAGIAAQGSQVVMIQESRWDGALHGDVAVFYGLEGNTPAIFEKYRTEAHAIYVDLGYWGRREGGRWTGFHKVVVDSRHPNAYYRRHPHPTDRLEMFHVEPEPWHGKLLREKVAPKPHILLAGMSDKGARAEGYEPEEWERKTRDALLQHTDREIRYRPKPSWKDARPIGGMTYSGRDRTAALEFENCWAVVTRHSNIAMEAVLAGVPAFCTHGVGADMACPDLSQIETPLMPKASDRRRWAADIAYCQWSIAEMREGLPWLHLLKEGLI